MRLPARKSGIHKCAFTRPKMEDLEVRVCPPENGESAGARSPARKRRICVCAFARPEMQDPQVRVCLP